MNNSTLALICLVGVMLVAATAPSDEESPTSATIIKSAGNHTHAKVLYSNASNFLANERTYLAWIRTVSSYFKPLSCHRQHSPVSAVSSR